MAEGGQLSLGDFKEEFDDQLTCSVCLDQYTNPKTLPCHHSYCLHCIEPIPVEIKDGKYYISCPTCRVDHLLPQGGLNSFPNAFHINSLFDLRKKLTATQKSTRPTQSICPEHSNPLKVYCETCDQVICQDCTINAEHKQHTWYLISECYVKHHQQILDNLDLVKHKLDDMNTAMTHLDIREREVFEHGENVKEQINAHTQQLINNIQRSRARLAQQVDTIVQQKTQTLATQRQRALKIHTQLKTCQDMIENSLKEWNQQQILAQKTTMMREMKAANEHADPAVFQPIEYANIQFNKDEKEMGSITGLVYGNATLEVSPCIAKQPSIVTLSLYSQDGSPFSLPPSLISSTLSSPGNEHSVKCPITQTQPGKYNITFTPSTRNDQLIVQVGGVDVPGNPFTLPVIPTLEMRGEPVNIITGFHQPCGIAVCDNGDIVVAERGSHRVTVLNRRSKKLKMFKFKNGFCYSPYGVAVSIDGHILVTDRKHQLQKLTTDGICTCVKSIDSCDRTRGCGNQLEFSPYGVAVNHVTGQIFVAERGLNNRIQVFTNDLTFSHTITSSRFGVRQFINPYDIAIDNEGYLYVSRNHCITKLRDNGKYIRTIGHERFGPGELSCPTYLTIHNNLVYVCESGNNRVSVFHTDGKFIRQFGGDGLLKCPSGITIDASGNLYVCDLNRIIVF